MLWAGLRSRRTEVLAGFGVGTESEFKTAMESEKMPDSKKKKIYIYIYLVFVHFTWAKLFINISLQDLQSWVA